MKCDYCGKLLSCGDDPRNAPNGLPLFVCKKCYEQLRHSRVVRTEEKINGQNNRSCTVC